MFCNDSKCKINDLFWKAEANRQKNVKGNEPFGRLPEGADYSEHSEGEKKRRQTARQLSSLYRSHTKGIC